MGAIAPARPVMRYHGGKWRLTPWIIEHLPPHRVYVEPFGGAASVLLQKPRSYAEVYNDLDGEVVNVFRVLRDRVTAAELERQLRLTPFSRAEFQEAYAIAEEPVEQARRTLIRAFMGFGSAAVNRDHSTGFRSNVTRSGTTPAQDWASYPEQVARFTERLQGVILECRPALAVLGQYDSPETLFYVDPPYPHGTRSYKARATGQVYRHEMTDDQHRELARGLRSVAGMVVLSGYPCELYDRELFPDWRRVTRETHADGARDRTEVLWINPAAWERLHGGLFAPSLLDLTEPESEPAPAPAPSGPMLTMRPSDCPFDPQVGELVTWCAGGSVVIGRVVDRSRGLEVEYVSVDGRRVTDGSRSLWTGLWPVLARVEESHA